MAFRIGPFARALACMAMAGQALVAQASAGGAQERTEPEAKATFLLKILSFVSWPAATDTPAQPIRVAFIGHSQVAREFARLVEARPKGARPIEYRYESADAGLEAYQVAFVAHGDPKRLQALADRAPARPLLTVCESPGGCEKGVILSMIVVDERIRYEINLRRARKAGLGIDSKVLHYAARICEGGGS